MSVDSINQRYSLEGLPSLDGYDAPERRKIERQQAERAQVIGGLAVSSHGQDRYLPWHLPWTGPQGSGITQVAESWTASEAFAAAKLLDWDLTKVEAQYPWAGMSYTAPGYFLIIRPPHSQLGTSRPTVLGACKGSYQIISNEHVLAALDALTDTGQARVETAGWLDGGRRVFASMQIGQTRYVLGDDPHQLHIALLLDHSGAGAAKALITGVRMHCANTVRLGEANADDFLRVAHRGDVQARLDRAASQLLAANGYFDAYAVQAAELAKIELDLASFEQLAAELYPEPTGEEVTDRSRSYVANRRADLVTTFKSSPTLEGIEWNGWRAYNAVGEYETWIRGAKPETRLNAIWEPDGRVTSRIRQTAKLLVGGRRSL